MAGACAMSVRGRRRDRQRPGGRRYGCCSNLPIVVPCIAFFATTPPISRATAAELGTETGYACCAKRARSARCSWAFRRRAAARDDLEIIVAEAHRLGFYTNLITSGVGLNEARMRAEGGRARSYSALISGQYAADERLPEQYPHLRSQIQVAALIKQYDYPMVLNVVLHRLNIDHVEEILEMA